MNIWLYIIIMALVTYLIRMLQLVLIRWKIENRFLRSFLYYLPYITLSAMTFPAILTETTYIWSGAAALIVAVLLSLRKKSLIVVALAASATVLVVEAATRYILTGTFF